MKKRRAILFLLFGLLVMMSFTNAKSSFAAYIPGTDGFWESFDTKGTGDFTNGDGWTNVNYYGGIASIVEEPDAANKSLQLVDNDYDTSSTVNAYRFGAFAVKEGFGGLSGKVVFETRYKVKQIDGMTPSYNIELYGGTQKAARMLQYSSGNFGIKTLSDATADNYAFPGGSSGSPLPIDQWVTVKMIIDTAARTYDLTVQSDSLKTYSGTVDSQAALDSATGTFHKTGIPLYGAFTGTEITKVQLYSNLYKGETYFDYIALYEASASPEAVITAPNQVNELEEFQVHVGVKNVTAAKAEDITVNYDANVFDYIGTEGAASGNSSTTIDSVEHEASTGSLRIVASNPGEANVIYGEAPVARITFRAKNVAATGQFAIANAAVADGSGNETIIETLAAASVTVSKSSALPGLISTTTALHNGAQEGVEDGTFIPGTLSGLKAALKQAIDEAQLVANKTDATTQEIDAAIRRLTAARDLFESKRIQPATGDINLSRQISIGDLGLAVGYFGKQSSDADWLSAKIADLNEDGKVDTVDLVFISRRITRVN
ncbi:cohesin domain-containing protein [Paenibacillus methanolicus]|uniref:Dockerin domain-containing protein n=1 Tax=Paenibacillus methanolicus TaxID=582686 RepID=A0A5S5CGS3_9BACL|nr:cohesin domain-containing protein [Paenibacillus methanolicus]TYP78989.1 hypothetical protein BCM02_101104 [Paenibacillus methanolicus]